MGTKPGADHQDIITETNNDHRDTIQTEVKRKASFQPAVFNYARHLNIDVPKSFNLFYSCDFVLGARR